MLRVIVRGTKGTLTQTPVFGRDWVQVRLLLACEVNEVKGNLA
jgi:hypothetical protein